MPIELTTQFQPHTDEVFKAESKKSILTNNDFNWDGASTIRIYKVSTSSMNDYNRNGPAEGNWSQFGVVQNLNATTQAMTLKKDRSFTFRIDKLDEDETQQQLQAAAALARQLREVVIPEVDTYIYKTMCEGAGIKFSIETLTSENIYSAIIEATVELDNAEVPESDRCLVVTPDTYLLMKQSKEIIMETDIGNDLRLKGVISNLDGLNVIKIPANRLPPKFGFLIAHSVATVAPTKLTDYRIHRDPPGISGSLVEGRINYDAFVLENKANALYYYELP